METITWIPGTNKELDNLFDNLREQHYNDKSHRLWKNYSREAFTNVAALTIFFNENGNPEVCSSITNKNCWPINAYRIHNRVWKPSNKKTFLTSISDSMGYSAISQKLWLESNTDCRLYFISRQTDNWEEWMIKHFRKFDLFFETDNYKYLTCPNECDISCWQKIIFNGDKEILKQWKRK